MSDQHVVSVRQARRRDIDAIGAFFRRAWREAGPGALGFTGASEDAVKEIWSPEFLARSISSPCARLFLAAEGGEVVGFASLRLGGGETAELSGIVVLEGSAGKGVGTRLLRKAEASALGSGVRELLVKTEAFNGRAIGFYEKNGFSRTWEASERVGRANVSRVSLQKRLRTPHPSKG